jgi:hypothetical protein
MQDYFMGKNYSSPHIKACASKFAFRRIFRSRHDSAADLSHMFSGIRKLALQKL